MRLPLNIRMSTSKMCNTHPVINCRGRAKPSHFTHSKTRRLGYAITGEGKNGKYMQMYPEGIGVSWETRKGYCTKLFGREA